MTEAQYALFCSSDSVVHHYFLGESQAVDELASYPGTTAYGLGYVIEKIEIDILGNIAQKDTIVVNNIGSNMIFDSKIKYDATYFYKIRSVYLVSFLSTVVQVDEKGDDIDQSLARTFLLCWV